MIEMTLSFTDGGRMIRNFYPNEASIYVSSQEGRIILRVEGDDIPIIVESVLLIEIKNLDPSK